LRRRGIRGIFVKIRSLAGFLGIFLCVSSSFALAEEDVLTDLNSLPGVTATETTDVEARAEGLRKFAAQIEQPVDHFDPSAGTFQQKLIVLHRGYQEPMVLQTSGYAIWGQNLSRPARQFGTNQLQVEHRFFETSSPTPKDWTKLTVRQSAEDFHRITETFKKLYPARWLNTGGSKGGMTSIFHRRFYPDDLDGTLADVAPISYSTEDERYVSFVESVGGERYADCRTRLEAFQKSALEKRLEILPSVTGEFTILGSKEVAFEHAVLEAPFVFWQYGNPDSAAAGCARVPAPDASTADIASFLKQANDPSEYRDANLLQFQPYFYQSGIELGGPAAKMIHLAGLLEHPYSVAQYMPVPGTFTDVTMRDVQDWVSSKARTIMFVYGEFDPWTAGAYGKPNSAEGADNHWYLQPAGNHGSNFLALPQKEKEEATAILSRWLNKAPVAQRVLGKKSETLEDIELRVRRLHKMR
jgi:hypothetical protein